MEIPKLLYSGDSASIWRMLLLMGRFNHVDKPLLITAAKLIREKMMHHMKMRGIVLKLFYKYYEWYDLIVVYSVKYQQVSLHNKKYLTSDWILLLSYYFAVSLPFSALNVDLFGRMSLIHYIDDAYGW